MTDLAGFPVELLSTDPAAPINPLMIGTDWAATPLGPVDEWTPALRTAVSVCLSSRFPMLIMWGPELAMVYNDAFVPILGAKHPALGQSCRQVWADAWPVVGVMIMGVLDRGEATYHEDLGLVLQRSGFDEEVYFTFSYSPILEPDGTVGGVLTVVTETTSQVLGARRMAALQRLGDVRATRPETITQACTAAMRVLGEHRADLPFGAVYLLDDDGQTAHLSAGYGMIADGLPATLSAQDAQDTDDWIWRAATDGVVVTCDGLAERLPELSLPGASPIGAAPVDVAVAVPLTAAGQGRASGVLVAGLSRYLPVDTAYRGFVELVARQVAAAVTDVQVYLAQRRRVEELAELDRAKTKFFTGVSHELRTPLALIAGPAEDSLLDVDNPLPPVQRQRLELVRRNSGRLRRLVDTLLDFARIEDGRLQPEPVAVDLGELTRGVAESFAPAVLRGGLTLSIDCPSPERPVLLDPDMWEKIVLNLLSNAVKFTLAGGVEVSLRIVDDAAHLRVRDTGVGIPDEEVPLLFQRFHQVRNVTGRSHEGSGIGLALVRELARLHDGDVDVHSRVGEGTTFTVRVPVRYTHGVAARTPRPGIAERYVHEALQWSPSPQDAAPTVARGTDLVLIAEDNADLRQYVAGLLNRHYRVAVAVDGQDALDQVIRLRPDLVLTDVMMPRLDGFGLLRALRGDSTTMGIPVIFLSAHAGEEAAIEGLAAGADDYLVKPFSSADLLARVRSNLDLARVRNHESAWRTALVNAMQDGFFVSTADGVVIEINNAFTTLLGYEASQLPFRPPHLWWPRSNEDPKGHAQASSMLGTVLAKGKGRFVVPMRHRDGRRLWMEVAVAALRDRDGAQQLIAGTLRDVTVEHLSAERDAAVVRLSSLLTVSEDSTQIIAVGMAELRSVWHAERVSIVRWDEAGEPRAVATTAATPPTGAALPPAGSDVAARTGRIVLRPDVAVGDTVSVTAVGAPIIDGTATVLLWLEFPGPRPFLVSDRTLLTQLCAHLQRAVQRARSYDEQRTVALTLQRAILGPATLPDGFAVRYQPAARALEVGGDWYDVVAMPEGRFGVVVGDVVGHSLAAATVMGQLRSAGRTLLLENHSPARVLEALDRFAALVVGAVSTTVFCAVVDPRGRTVRYSSAGHLPAILVGLDGVPEQLDRALSLPLAVLGDLNRPEESADLAPGSTLLLYTDGLVERRGEVIDTGIERATVALVEGRELSPAALVEYLAGRLLGDDHDDDVAFLTYRQPVTSHANTHDERNS